VEQIGSVDRVCLLGIYAPAGRHPPLPLIAAIGPTDNELLIAHLVAAHKFLPQFRGLCIVTGSGKPFTIFSFLMLAKASMAPGDFPHRGLCFAPPGALLYPTGRFAGARAK
jgi:hypothetical protein